MKRASIAAGVAGILLASTAAAEVEYGVEVGIGNSDNIARTPDNEESETILTTGVDLNWLREEGLLYADVDLDLSYFQYQDDAYDSEVVGLADAELRLRFAPQRFEWVITDRFGQSHTNPFVAATPGNVENVNYFSTGPDLTFRLGTAASVTLFGRYSMSTYEDSNFDDERELFGLSIGRDMSQRSRFAVNATTENVSYDDPLVGEEFDRRSYYLSYEAEGARTRMSAQAGLSEIDRGDDTEDYPLFSFNLSRDVSPRSVLSLSAGTRSSDAASGVGIDDVFGGGSGIPGRISTADTFEMRDARVAWDFSAPRTTFGLSVGYQENLYDTTTEFDRSRQLMSVHARRQITPRLSIEARAQLHMTEFDESGQEDDETLYGIEASWNAVGRLFIELDLDLHDRDSTVDETDFQELRTFLRFVWRSTGERAETR